MLKSNPSGRSITAAKRKEKEKKERLKKIKRMEYPLRCTATVGHFRARLNRKAIKHDASGKEGMLSCCNAFLGRIELQN